MIDFKALSLSDISTVRPLLLSKNILSCDYCFGNIFIWSPIYSTVIGFTHGCFVTRSEFEGAVSYCFPVGEDIEGAMLALLDDARSLGVPLELFSVSPASKLRLEQLFPGKFTYEADRDSFDYIYLTSDLINLPGRKYHQKRNHISAFLRENSDWGYEEINAGNIAECLEMNASWETANRLKNPDEIDHELVAVKRAFENYDELGFVGGLLRAQGKVIAFTLGERQTDEMFCTHIEKADATIHGAYQMINRLFAANTLSQYKYINREGDVGSENLRATKLAYHPAVLAEVFTVKEVTK